MIEIKSTKDEFNNCINIDLLSNFCYGGTVKLFQNAKIGEVGEVTD